MSRGPAPTAEARVSSARWLSPTPPIFPTRQQCLAGRAIPERAALVRHVGEVLLNSASGDQSLRMRDGIRHATSLQRIALQFGGRTATTLQSARRHPAAQRRASPIVCNRPECGYRWSRIYRSPRSPCPRLAFFVAFRGWSFASERPTSSDCLNCPRAPRRTYRLSDPVLTSVRFAAFRFAIQPSRLVRLQVRCLLCSTQEAGQLLSYAIWLAPG
jgi:hypothetical protein